MGVLGIAVSSVVLALSMVAVVPATPVAGARYQGHASPLPVGTISHVGPWLTDATGRVVLLHGVNMVEKHSPYYPAAFGFGGADAAWLQSNGLDVVRLGVLATGLMPQPGKIDERYLAHLASTVADLGRHHILVLLDIHQDGFGPVVGSDGFPAWMTVTGGAVNTHAGFPAYYTSNPATQQAFQSLWDNVRGSNGVPLQTDVATMVRALGRRFAGSSNVIGYDIFNEPWPGTTWQPCLSDVRGCPALDRRELDPFYARIDRALRSVDKRHLLFIEPFVLFNYGTAPTTVSLPGSDRASGLSFHQYALSAGDAAHVLVNARAWSHHAGGALINTEWGATTNSSEISSQAGQLDQALMSWIFWSFNGSVVRDTELPPAGPNLVASTVDALVRPYPLVVAGTPTGVSYDPATRRLHARWSTREPNGRTAPAGSVSTVEVPSLDYPSGYSVVVHGAKVVSRPHGDPLVLATAPGATSVAVTATPAGSR